jgi:hypothetical protein
MNALNKEQLLLIPLNSPGRLFPGDPSCNRQLFNELVKKWHPDHGGNGEVLSHIKQLYDASRKTKIDIQGRDGKHYQLQFLRQHEFELGHLFVCHKLAAFQIPKIREDFVLNGLRRIGEIRYPNEEFQKSLEGYFPKVERMVETENDYWILMGKTEDALPIVDLHSHMGTIPTKHVAWMVSSLLNLCCFMNINGLTHNGLTTKSVFVTPKNHAAFLLGGWWYSARINGDLKFLPPEVAACAPRHITYLKKANPKVDLESVRQIARSISGSDTPKPMREFFELPSADTAQVDYANWEKVLQDSFGARRFTELPILPSDIYGV